MSLLALAGLFLWAWPPSTSLFAYTLERWYPIRLFPEDGAQAIVVLSATIYKAGPSRPESLPNAGTYLRCEHAAWLYHHWKALPVLVSGGPSPGRTPVLMADVMRRTLVEAGVPDAAILTEGASRSTYENAAFCARILRTQGIHRVALVTEGYHMLRAAQCFRKQGIEVIPAGCSYRSLIEWRWPELFPSPTMMSFNEDTLHEWVGLGWYWIRGRV